MTQRRTFPVNVTLDEAFEMRVDRNGPDGCWNWLGSLTFQGYGRIQHNNIHYVAHRLSWERVNGEIPSGLVVDHLCRNPTCVNPAHLEPVTDAVNILRGTAPTAIAARATHCPQGHPLSGENLRLYKGFRMCAKCKRDHGRARYRRLNNVPPEKWRIA